MYVYVCLCICRMSLAFVLITCVLRMVIKPPPLSLHFPYLLQLLLIDCLLLGHLILDPLDVEPAQLPPWQCGEEGAVHVLGGTGLRTRQLWGGTQKGEGRVSKGGREGEDVDMLMRGLLLAMEAIFVSPTLLQASLVVVHARACVLDDGGRPQVPSLIHRCHLYDTTSTTLW